MDRVSMRIQYDFLVLIFFRQKLRREIKIWSCLNHPNVQPIFGFVMAEDLREYDGIISPVSGSFIHIHCGQLTELVVSQRECAGISRIWAELTAQN